MRLCFLADGMSVHLKEWVEYFAKRSHQVWVITFYPPLDIKGAHVIFINSRISAKIRYLLNVFKVRKLIREISPELLIAYPATSNGFMAACSGFHPSILSTAGSDVLITSRQLWHMRRMMKFSMSRADLITTWGAHVREQILRYGRGNERIVTFPRGIDDKTFKPGPKAHDRIKLISTRAFKPNYNIDLIVESAPDVLRRCNHCKFFMLNDGPLRIDIEKKVAQLGLKEGFSFLGAVAHLDVAKHLATSHIYVSTSLSDGISASLLEAMASGAFPVATDIAANREWIDDGENGFLVPANDPGFLAKRLVQAIEDKSLRESAMKMNRRIIQDRGCWDKNMKRMEVTYACLVKEHHSRLNDTVERQE